MSGNNLDDQLRELIADVLEMESVRAIVQAHAKA